MADRMRIGDMSDEHARLTILRATYEALGDVPVHATRHRDGGYLVTVKVDPALLVDIPCGAMVKVIEGEGLIEVPCERFPTDNIHRGDPDCDDPAAHEAEAPYMLHHPFLMAAAPTTKED